MLNNLLIIQYPNRWLMLSEYSSLVSKVVCNSLLNICWINIPSLLKIESDVVLLAVGWL